MFKQFLPDRLVLQIYTYYGSQFGDAESYWYMGEAVGAKRTLRKFKTWEKEYARRGYRTIPIEHFIDYGGGYEQNLKGSMIKREPDEDAVLHAQVEWNERYAA